MKQFLLALLGVILSLVPAPNAPAATEAARFNGKDYVALADWARARGLMVRWLKKDETVELTNSVAKLLLQVHSNPPEGQLNGVQVRLLFPLVLHNEVVFISRADVQTTFQPLLSPPKLRPGLKLRSICLDAGHGGKDPGFRVGHNQEKTYTLLLAQELRDQLKRLGWKVYLTRNSDRFLELPERPLRAKRGKADIFLSLHFNAVEGAPGAVQGAEVYCLTPPGAPSTNAGGEGGGAGWFTGNRFNDENVLLAYQLQRALTRGVSVEDRGVHRARFWVLRDANMPAALVEAGFMSHPVEGRKIFSAAYRRQLARAIVDGLLAYQRVVERRT